MPSKAMILTSDSSNSFAYAHDERPPLRLTLQGQQAVTTGPKGSRLYTLTPEAIEALNEPLPMDALPQIEILLAPPCGDDYGGF